VTKKMSIPIGSLSNDTIPVESHSDIFLKWDDGNDSELGYFKPPKNYPLKENFIAGKYLKEKIVTFEGLNKA
jgi:hypothetical protein